MKILFRIVCVFLLWTWQLPQTLLGLCVYLIFSKKNESQRFFRKDGGKVYLLPNNSFISGCCLGYFILIKPRHSETVFKHEYGHVKQGYVLGWLYLIAVGVPSVINNLQSRKWYGLSKAEVEYRYYSRYPEAWADRLGGVKREWL